MFSNLKVGAKLGLGFGLIIVLMLIISSIGITRMAGINASVEVAANDRWPKTVLLNDILFQSNRIAISLRNMMLTDNLGDQQQQKEQIMESRKIIATAVEKLEATVNQPKGRELLAQLKDQRHKYVAGQDRLIQLIEQDQRLDAGIYLRNDLRPVLRSYQDNVTAFARFQGDLMDAAARESAADYQAARNTMFILTALAIVMASLLAFWITRNLTRQLGGEPDYAADVARRVAAGDLTVDIELRAGDRESLLAAMKHMVEHLGQTIAEIRGAANALSSASREVSATSQSLAQGASEQAASLEETTAAMEEMAASIAQNTENAGITDGMANQSAANAGQGGEAVVATVAAMKSIAGKIGIVDDIAYQTNLLALNAAIEAARAGEHGKGFAVVAAEVRKLAERSQVAAQEIGELAESSVRTAEEAGGLLEEIVPAIRKTAGLVQEIAAASNEQASGAHQINTAMAQLNQTTQQNASASEELSATAEEMNGQAEQLQLLIERFKVMESSSKGAPRGGVKRPSSPQARGFETGQAGLEPAGYVAF